MNTSSRFLSVLAATASILFVTPAFGTVNIDYVIVGNAGNVGDTRVMWDSTSGYGAVAYNYKIAKNETTISQYAEFLNAVAKTDPYGLYKQYMGSTGGCRYIAGIDRSGSSGSYTYSVLIGSANMPITFVNWFDAARFCNWMHNGQGSGSTETGAYTLNGAMGGVSISKNVGARVWIPSENEWYKAAYYDPNKGGAGVGGYWLQATQSDTMTTNDFGVAGAANFRDANGYATHDATGFGSWAITNVGAYGENSNSFYGTNDQAGNVYEWNDAVISGSLRGQRGGAWPSDYYGLSSSQGRSSGDPGSAGSEDLGFRVASVLQSPSVTTGATTEINGVSIILQGTVNPNGTTTTAQFEYGPTTAYGTTATVTLSPNIGSTPQNVSTTIGGLQPGQVYHYRLTATNAGGTTPGADMTFATRCVLTITALHGTVPGAGRHDAGSSVELIPTPDPGYVFSEWTGGATGNDNPLTVVMGSDKTITAVFDPDTNDDDVDGLTNYQEIVLYGTNPTLRDTDGDGFLDGYEVLTGKSALDPLDKPVLVAEARPAIEFTFSSALGKTYRIEGSPDMSTWTTVESGIAGNGGQIQRFYSTRNVPQRFLRVEEGVP